MYFFHSDINVVLSSIGSFCVFVSNMKGKDRRFMFKIGFSGCVVLEWQTNQPNMCNALSILVFQLAFDP